MKNYIEKFKIENQTIKDKIPKTLSKAFLIFNYRAYRQAGRFYFYIFHFSFLPTHHLYLPSAIGLHRLLFSRHHEGFSPW